MNDRAHVLRRPRRARPPIARQQFGVSTSRLQAAQRTCQHLHPATGGLANCPDPTTDSQGRPYFDLSAHGFSWQQAHSPQIRATVGACGHGLPTGLPQG